MANDVQSLAHTKWNCKYHIVFAPKYRRMVFYGEKKREIGKILRQLCEWKGVEIQEAEVCPAYPYAGKHTTKGSSIKFYGISKGQKQCTDIREIWRIKVQVQEQRILVSGILRGYGRKEYQSYRRVYPASVGRGQDGRTVNNVGKE